MRVMILALLVVGAMLAPSFATAPVLAKESGERVVVRPDGARGRLIAYDPRGQMPPIELPAGMLAADGSRYAAVAAGDATASTTWLELYEIASGSQLARYSLDGSWRMGGISPDGHWVALIAEPDEPELKNRTEGKRWRTYVTVVDSDRGAVAHEMELTGNFEVDAISSDGASLFLIQHLPAEKPEHYQVRLVDLATETLQEGALRDKRFFDEVMTGLAWDGLGSVDGHWLFTLYVNTDRDAAFIHALDLRQKFSLCIALPSGDGNIADLAAYSLSIDPKGDRVYAANPALGVVAEVDLAANQVTRTVRFPAGVAPDDTERSIPSVVAAESRKLYFTDGRALWGYDGEAGTVSALRAFGSPVLGLGISDDGETLYVAGEAGQASLEAIDASSGAVVSLPGSAAAGDASASHLDHH